MGDFEGSFEQVMVELGNFLVELGNFRVAFFPVNQHALPEN